MGYSRLDAKDWGRYVEEVHHLYMERRLPVARLVEHFKEAYGLAIT